MLLNNDTINRCFPSTLSLALFSKSLHMNPSAFATPLYPFSMYSSLFISLHHGKLFYSDQEDEDKEKKKKKKSNINAAIIRRCTEINATLQHFNKVQSTEILSTIPLLHTDYIRILNKKLPIITALPFGSTARYCPGTILRQPLLPNVS